MQFTDTETFARHIEAETGFDVKLAGSNTDTMAAMQFTPGTGRNFEFGVVLYRKATGTVTRLAGSKNAPLFDQKNLNGLRKWVL